MSTTQPPRGSTTTDDLRAAEALAVNVSGGLADEHHVTATPVQRLRELMHARATLGPTLVLFMSILLFTFWADSSRFFASTNFSLILQQVMVVGTIAIGQTLVVLTAGVDLSVGAIMVFSMLAMGKLSENGMNGYLALVLGLAIGAACGLLNGVIVTRFKLPPFIVTLATLYVFFTLNLYISKSASIRGTDVSSVMLWTGKTFTIAGTKFPYGVVIMLLLFALASYCLRLTAWGRHVYATGDDAEAARLAGIRTDRVLISVYVIAGILCAIAGWILFGRLASASPQAGQNDNLNSITAVVIGGTSLFGGRGRVRGTLLGALTVGVFRNGLVLAGVDDIWQNFAVGVLILLAVLVDQWTRRATK